MGSGIRNIIFDLRWSYGYSNPGPLACHHQAAHPPESIPAGHRPCTYPTVHRNPDTLRYFAAVLTGRSAKVQGRCGTSRRAVSSSLNPAREMSVPAARVRHATPFTLLPNRVRCAPACLCTDQHAYAYQWAVNSEIEVGISVNGEQPERRYGWLNADSAGQVAPDRSSVLPS